MRYYLPFPDRLILRAYIKKKSKTEDKRNIRNYNSIKIMKAVVLRYRGETLEYTGKRIHRKRERVRQILLGYERYKKKHGIRRIIEILNPNVHEGT